MKKRYFLNIIISILFIIGTNFYFFESNNLGNRSIFNILLFICCIFLIDNNKNEALSSKKIPFIFSFLLALSLVIGRIIDKYNDLFIVFRNIKEWIYFLIMLTGFTSMFTELFSIIFKKLDKINFNHQKIWKIFTKKYTFIAIWILIFISWIPAYLAYFPGILSYDAGTQTMEIQGILPYSQFHPPLHTFIWQICLSVGNVTHIEPLIIYSIIQMTLLSFVLAKSIKYLIDNNGNNYLIVFALLFYTINPAIAIFSFCVTKDVYFSCFLVLFVLEIINLLKNPDKYLYSLKKDIRFIFIALLMCLFRNNAIYVYVIFGIIILIYLRKYLKMVALIIITPFIIFILITKVFYPFIGLKPGKSAEMLSVPIQQLSRVVKLRDSELDENTKAQINKFFSYKRAKTKYNPRLADRVKDTFNSTYFDNNKSEFFDLWFKLLKKYPNDYITAFLTLNLPYWYIDASTVDNYSKVMYIETKIYNNKIYTTQRNSLLPGILKQYSKVEYFEFVKDKPLIVNLFSITTPLWLMLFTLFKVLNKNNKKEILIILPGLLLWLTHIVGPVSNFRYIFAIFIQYPIYLSLIFNNKKIL